MNRFANRDFAQVNDAFKQLQRLPDFTVLAYQLTQSPSQSSSEWATTCYADRPAATDPSELPYATKPSPG